MSILHIFRLSFYSYPMSMPSGTQHQEVYRSLPSLSSLAKTSPGNAISEASSTASISDLEASRITPNAVNHPPTKQFKSLVSEFGFCFAMATSQVLAEYLLTGFGPIFGVLAVDLKSTTSRMAWASCIHSVVTASTTLPFARFADIYGGYPIFIFGMCWLFIWTLVAGFATNATIFTICRAMHGFALSAIQPASLSMIGTVYKAGKKRNIALGVFGASAPLGFFAGIASGTVSANFNHWPWYFWAASVLSLLAILIAALTSPTICRGGLSSDILMDWWGSFTTVAGLLLITYSLVAGSKYDNGYYAYKTLVPLGIGLICLGAAVYVELKVAACPLLPRKFFKAPSMKPFMLACLFFYGTFGIFIFYSTF